MNLSQLSEILLFLQVLHDKNCCWFASREFLMWSGSSRKFTQLQHEPSANVKINKADICVSVCVCVSLAHCPIYLTLVCATHSKMLPGNQFVQQIKICSFWCYWARIERKTDLKSVKARYRGQTDWLSSIDNSRCLNVSYREEWKAFLYFTLKGYQRNPRKQKQQFKNSRHANQIMCPPQQMMQKLCFAWDDDHMWCMRKLVIFKLGSFIQMQLSDSAAWTAVADLKRSQAQRTVSGLQLICSSAWVRWVC